MKILKSFLDSSLHKNYCDNSIGNIYSSNTGLCDCGLEKARQELMNIECFIEKFLKPEEYGYVVGPVIRDEARIILGIKPCETV